MASRLSIGPTMYALSLAIRCKYYLRRPISEPTFKNIVMLSSDSEMAVVINDIKCINYSLEYIKKYDDKMYKHLLDTNIPDFSLNNAHQIKTLIKDLCFIDDLETFVFRGNPCSMSNIAYYDRV